MAFPLIPLAIQGGRLALRYGLPALVRTGQNIMRGRGVMQPGAYRGLKPGGTKAALTKRGLQGLGIADLGFGISGAVDVAQGLRGIDRPEDTLYGAAEPQQRVVQGVGDVGISSLFTPELVKAFGLKGKAINKFANFIGSTGGIGSRGARGLGIAGLSSVGSEFIPSSKPGPQFAQKVLSDPILTAQYPYSLESKKITDATTEGDLKDAGIVQEGDSFYTIKERGIPDPEKITSSRRKGRNQPKTDTRETFQEVLDKELLKIAEKEQLENEAMQKEAQKTAELNKKVRFDVLEEQTPGGQINPNAIERVKEEIDERVTGGDSATNNFVIKTGEELLNEEEQGSPDPAKEEVEYFGFIEAYQKANELIEKEKAKLIKENTENRQTFDEFYSTFRKNAGLDVPNETANYAAYNFFNNLSAPTNATGMAGFAEAAARASTIYSEDMLQLYQTEKQTRAQLAADFMQHNRDLDAALGTNMAALLKEQRANLIDQGKTTQDYLNEQAKHIMDIREAKRGKLQPGSVRFNFIMPYEEGKFMKLRTYELAESSDTGEKLIQIMSSDGRPVFVPFDSPELNQPQYAELKKALVNPGQYGAYDVPILKPELRLEPLNMMNKSDQAIKNIVQVLDLGKRYPSLISAGGAFRQAKEKLIGIPSEIIRTIGSLDEITSTGYDLINTNRGDILNEVRSKTQQAGEFNAKHYNDLKTNLENADKIQTKAEQRLAELEKSPDLVMNYNGFVSNKEYSITDGDGNEQMMSGADIIKTISKLEIIETRMKYLLANVYKEKDRLTVYDLQEMARNTDIVTFYKTPNQIIGAYEKLYRDMMEIYESKLNEAVTRGVKINEMNGQFKNHYYFQRGRPTKDDASNASLIEFGSGPTAVPGKDDLKGGFGIEEDLKGLDLGPKITPEKEDEDEEESEVQVRKGRGRR